jgi:hypothetical protein
MILGMSVDTFLKGHVVLSLLGIATGLVVLFEMLRGRDLAAWTAAFLITTILTSATGFPLPPYGLDPPRIFGIVSLVLLALALAGLYAFKLRGSWRWVYVVTAIMALYLNCFVAVTQTFQKVAFFNALAPTQTEPPFAIAQVALLAIFVWLGFVSVKRFRPPFGK